MKENRSGSNRIIKIIISVYNKFKAQLIISTMYVSPRSKKCLKTKRIDLEKINYKQKSTRKQTRQTKKKQTKISR